MMDVVVKVFCNEAGDSQRSEREGKDFSQMVSLSSLSLTLMAISCMPPHCAVYLFLYSTL